MFATGGIHLDLYLLAYREIPTIGPLFLFQVIGSFTLAVLVLMLAWRLVALAGAGFCAATLGGYILSRWVGLFGFHEIGTPAGTWAGVIEIAAIVVLVVYAMYFARGWVSGSMT